MRRHHTPLADDQDRLERGQAPELPDDVTQEFWGTTRGWVSREQPTTRTTGRLRRTITGSVATTDDTRRSRDDTTGAIRAIRDGVSAFRPQVVDRRSHVDRTRSHGIVRPSAPPVVYDDAPPVAPTDLAARVRRERAEGRDSTIGELGAGAPTWTPDPADPGGTDPWTDDTPTSVRRPAPAISDAEPRARELDGDGGRGPTDMVPVVGLSSVDPHVVRFGLAALVLALMVPLALALRPSDDTPPVDTVTIEGVTDTEVGGSREGGAPAIVSPEVAADPAANATPPPDDDAAPAAEPADDAAVGTGSSAEPQPAAEAQPPAASAAAADEAPEPAATAAGATEAGAPASDDTTTGGATDDASDASASDESASSASVSSDASASSSSVSSDDAPEAQESSERAEPSCAQTYSAGPGDSWYRIAEASGMGVDALLDQNGAALDTTIFPGDDICLAADAEVPVTPTTTAAPAATSAPATTTAPTTAAPTTAAPTATAPPTTAAPTTAAPTTAAPAPSAAPASADEVQAIIREIWPADQHEMALKVARRESSFNPSAYNGFCCYGVFQIYYSVHQSWLRDYGINSSSDLLDARKNITAAYALYQRSGGWTPWRQTAY